MLPMLVLNKGLNMQIFHIRVLRRCQSRMVLLLVILVLEYALFSTRTMTPRQLEQVSPIPHH